MTESVVAAALVVSRSIAHTFGHFICGAGICCRSSLQTTKPKSAVPSLNNRTEDAHALKPDDAQTFWLCAGLGSNGQGGGIRPEGGQVSS